MSRFFQIVRPFSNMIHAPKVQIMHAQQKTNDGKGRYHYTDQLYSSSMPIDVRDHNPSQQNIMIEQASLVSTSMQKMLHSAMENFGSYEKFHHQNHPDRNTVLHLATPEFFFYPKYSLFSYEIFQEYIEKPLRAALIQYPSWLNFHLGTFPIQLTTRNLNGKIVEPDSFINAAFYGRCGPNGILKFYSKKHHYLKSESLGFEFDLNYAISQQKPGDPYTDKMKSFDLDYPSIFSTETDAGTSFNIVMEICLDHAKQRAIKELKKYMQYCEHHHILPTPHGFHSIVSNSTSLSNENFGYSLISHADALAPATVVLSKEKGEKSLIREFFSLDFLFQRGETQQPYIKIDAPNDWVKETQLIVYETLAMPEIMDQLRSTENSDSFIAKNPHKP